MPEEKFMQDQQRFPEKLSSDSFPLSEEGTGDEALDRLLARARAPQLSPGFADRVLHSVAPVQCTQQASSRWGFSAAKALGVAAALVIGAGSLLLWNTAPSAAPLPTGSTDDERLLAALRSPEITGEDLVVVANLGAVLEAELIDNHPLWLDEK